MNETGSPESEPIRSPQGRLKDALRQLWRAEDEIIARSREDDFESTSAEAAELADARTAAATQVEVARSALGDEAELWETRFTQEREMGDGTPDFGLGQPGLGLELPDDNERFGYPPQ